MTMVPDPYDERRAREFVRYLRVAEADPECLELGAFERESGSLVGMISLSDLNAKKGCAELGYWIAIEAQGRGYAKEACEALLTYGFRALGMQRIQAFVCAGNDASCSLLSRLGFLKEGTLRRACLNKNELVDRVAFGMLREEWEAGDPHRKLPGCGADRRTVRRANRFDVPAWLSMRRALWPDCPAGKHEREIRDALERPHELPAWLCIDGLDISGFLECSYRDRFDAEADGFALGPGEAAADAPSLYVEGVYVKGERRKANAATSLLTEAEREARARFCARMLSDVEYDNDTSLRAHARWGYREIGRGEESILLEKPLH